MTESSKLMLVERPPREINLVLDCLFHGDDCPHRAGTCPDMCGCGMDFSTDPLESEVRPLDSVVPSGYYFIGEPFTCVSMMPSN